MTNPTVTLMWAMAENGVIGANGGLPWHLPDELRHFKAKTIGSAVIMGRKTWESLPMQPLPNRQNIVVTNNRSYQALDTEVAHSLEGALELVTGPTAFVIGGESLFSAALPIADRLEATIVHAAVEGDTTMPPIDWKQWALIGEEHHPADERHEFSFTYRTFELAG